MGHIAAFAPSALRRIDEDGVDAERGKFRYRKAGDLSSELEQPTDAPRLLMRGAAKGPGRQKLRREPKSTRRTDIGRDAEKIWRLKPSMKRHVGQAV